MSTLIRQVGDQASVVLTAHPLQRVGAYALAALAAKATTGELADAKSPADVLPEELAAAVSVMVRDAENAAEAGRVGVGSFWLKASGAFFPNSPMNHRPTLGKRTRGENNARISAWRTMPDPATWPGVPCALCGRDAVAFHGKVDVPLIEAAGVHNAVPSGHGGLALCWPCVCCFHALPYAARLTGGPSSVVHSWEDQFVRRSVMRQLDATYRRIVTGSDPGKSKPNEHELTVLRRLRDYDHPLAADVELLVFSNDNRGASLSRHSLGVPLAEWLRTTLRDPARKRGWQRLVAAYTDKKLHGSRPLAYDAFHRPTRIFVVATSRLTAADGLRAVVHFDRSLAALCCSFVREVMQVNQADIELVETLAGNIAARIAAEERAGALTTFRHQSVKASGLMSWLERESLLATLGRKGAATPSGDPFYTAAQFRLLFDFDGQGWLYRRLLVVAVLEALHSHPTWPPPDAVQKAAELGEAADFHNDNELDDEAGA
ncbi:hypothetical protein [Frankia sp. AgKG'84/4]|uniref:hypothetical protein n=1 Tax=Frankia sp. AgKG'84/4 TaxID=573490 RepID=UPI00200EB133|nr:hypothetical protein [Frankia sp. AgKG'84/4]MCL9793801.1 hypothetical protein [Frankia sp. AgKG'84/4]